MNSSSFITLADCKCASEEFQLVPRVSFNMTILRVRSSEMACLCNVATLPFYAMTHSLRHSDLVRILCCVRFIHPHDAHWLSRGVKSSPNKATASLIRKCCCNANQIIPLCKFWRYSSSWRRIGSEIFTSLLEILAVWENARCSRTICIHQRDGGIRLFLARVEAVVTTNERTVRTRGSNI